MEAFTAPYAQNHFGMLIDAACIAPVAVTKYDKPFVTVMAVEDYERMMTLAEPETKIRKAKKAFKQAARSGYKK